MSKVTGFVQGATSSGMNTWYAAVLDCKHWHYSLGWRPFSADVTIGTEIDCDTCSHHADAIARLEALDVSKVHHLRFDGRFAYPDQGIGGSYHAYRRDPASPSGMMLIASFPAIPEIDAIIDRKHLCALSPTEGRER